MATNLAYSFLSRSCERGSNIYAIAESNRREATSRDNPISRMLAREAVERMLASIGSR